MEVIIIGAGPAGLTAAYFLGRQGIPVKLFEKERFPRDKICGDCLGGFAMSVIKQMGPGVLEKFEMLSEKLVGGGVHFFGPKHEFLSVEATQLISDTLKEVALIKRIDFDSFLFRQVQLLPSVTFIHEDIRDLIKKPYQNEIEIYNQRSELVGRSNMIILATGSNQLLIRKLTGRKINRKNMAAGLRCYFRNVTLPDNNTYIELHFLDKLAPGYFWIFPLPNNEVNVGLGLRSDLLTKSRVNLKDTLLEIILNNPRLKERFRNAEMIGSPMGYPLYLGLNRKKISGDQFLLAGDTANLIEPLFGEGIGNAMYSGLFAANHVIKTLTGGYCFDAVNNQNYDNMVYKKMGSTLRFSAMMHRIAFSPHLMSYIFRQLKKKKELNTLFQGLINGQVPKTPAHGIQLLVKVLDPFS